MAANKILLLCWQTHHLWVYLYRLKHIIYWVIMWVYFLNCYFMPIA